MTRLQQANITGLLGGAGEAFAARRASGLPEAGRSIILIIYDNGVDYNNNNNNNNTYRREGARSQRGGGKAPFGRPAGRGAFRAAASLICYTVIHYNRLRHTNIYIYIYIHTYMILLYYNIL